MIGHAIRRPSALRSTPLRALVVVVLFGWLGACETVKRLPSQVGELGSRVGGWFSFGGSDGEEIAADPRLIVLPLTGTDWLGRPALAEEIARLLRGTTPNARADTRSDGHAQTLAGEVQLIEESGAVVWLEIVWTHQGGDGRVLAEHRQIAAMDRKLWDRAAPAAVQMIASEIAPKTAGLLRQGSPRLDARRGVRTNEHEIGFGGSEVASRQPTAPPPPPLPRDRPTNEGGISHERGLSPATPVREIAAAPVAPVQGSPLSSAWANPVILIKTVDGAPGDGNQALMLAIKQALRVRDFMVTEDPRQAVFLLDGRVEIAPPANGRQRAKVVWTVSTVSGGQVGRAIQENTIPAGSLNGVWGQVATMVANAAADGVEELFGRSSSRRAQAVVPPTPPLPQVPGRAPPPR